VGGEGGVEGQRREMAQMMYAQVNKKLKTKLIYFHFTLVFSVSVSLSMYYLIVRQPLSNMLCSVLIWVGLL
jgi:hypothetical protein